MITCPKCNREQYYTCGKESCICNSRVPAGEKPQVYLGNDVIACPYCGFAEHIDFWAELQIAAQANNACTPTVGIQPQSEPLSAPKQGTGVEYLSAQPHSG